MPHDGNRMCTIYKSCGKKPPCFALPGDCSCPPQRPSRLPQPPDPTGRRTSQSLHLRQQTQPLVSPTTPSWLRSRFHSRTFPPVHTRQQGERNTSLEGCPVSIERLRNSEYYIPTMAREMSAAEKTRSFFISVAFERCFEGGAEVATQHHGHLPAKQVTVPAPFATSPEIFLSRWLLVSATYRTRPE